MSTGNFFDLELTKAVCIGGISEDSLRTLVDAIKVKVQGDEFSDLVLSSSGVQLKFQFGPDGSFQGAYAKQNGEIVVLIPGTSSKGLEVFKGPPSATNPGNGWKLEPELTVKYFNQPNDENQWEIFYASRESVLNTF